jgi:hypothetical protein
VGHRRQGPVGSSAEGAVGPGKGMGAGIRGGARRGRVGMQRPPDWATNGMARGRGPVAGPGSRIAAGNRGGYRATCRGARARGGAIRKGGGPATPLIDCVRLLSAAAWGGRHPTGHEGPGAGGGHKSGIMGAGGAASGQASSAGQLGHKGGQGQRCRACGPQHHCSGGTCGGGRGAIRPGGAAEWGTGGYGGEAWAHRRGGGHGALGAWAIGDLKPGARGGGEGMS